MKRETYLSTQKTAELVGVRTKTLASWRRRDTGPPYTKVGHLVRYPLSQLELWLEQRTVIPPKNGVNPR